MLDICFWSSTLQHGFNGKRRTVEPCRCHPIDAYLFFDCKGDPGEEGG